MLLLELHHFGRDVRDRYSRVTQGFFGYIGLRQFDDIEDDSFTKFVNKHKFWGFTTNVCVIFLLFFSMIYEVNPNKLAIMSFLSERMNLDSQYMREAINHWSFIHSDTNPRNHSNRTQPPLVHSHQSGQDSLNRSDFRERDPEPVDEEQVRGRPSLLIPRKPEESIHNQLGADRLLAAQLDGPDDRLRGGRRKNPHNLNRRSTLLKRSTLSQIL